MKLTGLRRLPSLVMAIGIALVLLGAGAAIGTHFSGHVQSSGTNLEAQINQSASGTGSVFRNTSGLDRTVPGASTAVFIPSGDSDLINARFVGHTEPTGGASCRAVIVAVKGSSTIVLEPTGYAILDSGAPTSPELRTLERSKRLGAGLWSIQFRINRQGGTNGSCTVFNWHFAVEQIN